ncbi:TadE/TadG family type IV pilus assembly protein [Aureimonas leprariae]|uniref:Pilus assembly protein n=1 Tax=Plantimonas leprariae TaxID=2615207 RepID=A0A7V7TWF6_9HYPH|nr:TadE/TadG family type IV pilus assembly protein [Aureimonas leprariae]KAB0679785.1 pilus assembly protein [Aureimonas leprariae]
MRTERLRALDTTRRWRRDIGGVAAIEFALIMPALVFLYLGSVDLTTGWTIKRKVSHSVSAMSDLVTRINTLTKSDLDDIFKIGDATMTPRAAALGTAKITAIGVDGTGKAKVTWSYARNTTKDTVGTLVTLPSDLAGLKNVSLVRTSASYDYTPPGASRVIGTVKLEKQIYGQTRTGTAVACTDC